MGKVTACAPMYIGTHPTTAFCIVGKVGGAHPAFLFWGDFHVAFWDCCEEFLAVAFLYYSGVEDYYDSGVGFAAD